MDYPKPASFRTLDDFRAHLAASNIPIGLAELPPAGESALAKPLNGIGNRWAVLPMEGWDCGRDGTPSEFTRRRWLRFASSGAKLIYGTEAAAVMHSGRSNTRQLLVADHTAGALKQLNAEMRRTHRERFGTDSDLKIGLQLTHSGRFSHPDDDRVLASKTAYAHPLLDQKFRNDASNVVTDDEVADIIAHFIRAAELAQDAGFDFVDVKLAHGYLGHEFLTAYDRPGPFGGSFENRTRFFREIAEGIRKRCPGLELSSRVSIFDIRPFVKGPDGVGVPMDWDPARPYPYAFGGAGDGLTMDPGLKDTVALVGLMRSLGVKMICATIGSPYYCVHIQRPAFYPVSDGYLPPHDPLRSVWLHIEAVRRLRELCPGLLVVGSGYTALQEYLPHAAEYAVANGLTDFVGFGRMALSYPDFCADVLAGRPLRRACICRTFGDCTNAPRAGLISGCYPLDECYKKRPEAKTLAELKKAAKNKQ
ncbi:MAG: NADH:flavin oxidoreductase [Lentisphaeria bacterium]|nr:NADH:flavin oxidoreductase [Lentisphaeria bacterium]